MRFFIQTFGCQMNDHDSQMLARLLEQDGYLEVAEASAADVVLVNTCAIRDKAEQKVYSQLGRYRELKRERPELVLAVGGCVAQGEGRQVLKRAPHVDLVFGTQTVHEVPDLLRAVRAHRRPVVATELPSDPARLARLYANARAHGPKAFVTVMQGCDNYCAYCVVPYVRGREVSRPADEVVAEVERLAAEGVVEVALLGQNVNSFGQKPKGSEDFAGLVRRVAGVPGIRRVRFTTSHPKDLDPRLIACFATEPKVMPHLHLPIQSGSDRILAAMGRGYTVAGYLELVDRVRAARPGIALTSDIIVGFPGETEEDFAGTLAVMERVVFDNLFSFQFSPRPGTAAARLPDPVPAAVRGERLARLQALQREHSLACNRALVGQVRPVLVEGVGRAGEGQVMGRTPENKIVGFVGDQGWVGREREVRIVEAGITALGGELLPAEV